MQPGYGRVWLSLCHTNWTDVSNILVLNVEPSSLYLSIILVATPCNIKCLAMPLAVDYVYM